MELKCFPLRLLFYSTFTLIVTLLSVICSYASIYNAIDSFPKREFRGVWVATVNNIDWPSAAGLTSQQQQKEFIELVNYSKNLGLNALIVQIRPSADALYHSNIEPWSHWLSGKQGEAPAPYYDPLSFMIETCHEHDLEFHAWINPFRSVQSKYMKISEEHIASKKPEWHIYYNGMQMLNPGIPAVRNYVCEVIEDIITRYPVDAIHFDDYFYPYPVAGKSIDDSKTFQKYNPQRLSIAAWRRENINVFIEQVSNLIKKTNSKIKFGVSPPGIWRNIKSDPDGSKTNGLSSYDDLYADSRLWIQQKWIDYIIPQLYWNVDHKLADYQTLIDWWQQNCKGVQLYIGHAAYKMEESKLKSWKDGNEINRQIARNRQNDTILGSAFFSASSLLQNEKNFSLTLKQKHYKKPALRPVKKQQAILPSAPLKLSKVQTEKGWWLTWSENPFTSNGDTAKGYLLYRFPDTVQTMNYLSGDYLLEFLPCHAKNFHDTTASNANFTYLLTAYDKQHQESLPAFQIFEDTTTLELNNVVVGFGKAQIDAVFMANLKKGTNRVLIKNLPQTLIKESLTINPDPAITISSIRINADSSFQIISNQDDSLYNYLNQKKATLHTSLISIKDSLEIFNDSEDILNKNRVLSKDAVSVSSIRELDEYFNKRMLEIKTNKRRLENSIKVIREKINFIENQITAINQTSNDLSKSWAHNASIDISSEKAGKISFEISYQVTNVNWTPLYRTSFNKFEEKLMVSYMAAIQQESGQHWVNIPLSVSSELTKETVEDQPKTFKVAPQNISIRSSNKEKLVTLGESYPTFTYSLEANVDTANSPNTIIQINDATQHEWFPGNMQVFINDQLKKSIAFIPEILKDTITLNLGTDQDIVIRKETVYDSIKNKIILKVFKQNEKVIIKNNKNKNIELKVTLSPKQPLKNTRSTQFFKDANNHFNFDKQQFIWNLKLEANETKYLNCAYQYQQSAFRKKP